MTAVDLTGSTILVTGVTGQVAAPLAVSLARQATVIGAARFSNPTKRTELEAAGVSCVTSEGRGHGPSRRHRLRAELRRGEDQ